MCSKGLMMVAVALIAVSCSPYRKMRDIRSGTVALSLSVPDEPPLEEDEDVEVSVDSIRGTLVDEPLIMNAIRESETGEMVATDIIRASRVIARFRNVAERSGKVDLAFQVIVPEAMMDSKWQLRFHPDLYIMEDSTRLDPVIITGTAYRKAQLRGYQQYDRFLARIIQDRTRFLTLTPLDIFLKRKPKSHAATCFPD